MTSQEIKALTGQYIMNTYGRFPVAIDHGQGATLYDPEGNAYIDFTSGIGVSDLGYGCQPWVDAIAKQAGNVRDVGATLGWRFGRRVPVVLEAGVFNGSGLTAQKDFWTGRFNYSLKAQARLGGRFNLSASVQKIRPGEVDIMMYDAGAYYEHGRWHVEGEYLRKEYADGLFPGVNAVDAFVCRDFPLRRWFRKVSVLARYDYMSDHSDGLFGEGGVLETDDARRHLLTGGLTFSLGLPFTADIRLNYEAYFYRESARPALSEQDKLVVELMCRF